MQRIALFLLTNLAILVVLNISLRLLGVERILDESGTGLDIQALTIFSAVIGFGGAFISLALSKWTAKRMMGVRIIEQPRTEQERWLVDTVARQAKASGIGMPEVGIFDQPVLNAFATGANRNNALVAVSSGLLQGMTREEAEAVLGHEVAHVANGDMVTMTLIQGVINTFVVLLSRVLGHIVDRVVFKNERGHGPAFWITTIVAEIVLAILASMIVMAFSRYREFRADAGGANLTSRAAMIAALERLKQASGQPPMPDQLAAFGIRGGLGKFGKLFSSHPPLDERIRALRANG
ncbi:MAG: protease HtpX [Gammaproteobacteria bacterium]|jgi:heat shock protein HtpX